MAALAADIEAIFDPRWNVGLMQHPATAADTYYRGGLAHTIDAGGATDGEMTLTPGATSWYLGVVMEHKVVAAAQELVWVAMAGRWFFTCAEIKAADCDKTFAMVAGDLFDNPASLDANTAGSAGAVGRLWLVTTTATSGWIDTDHRSAAVNA